MKKIALSLAALAALSTGAFAASSFEKLKAWNELERPESATAKMVAIPSTGSTDTAAFAVLGKSSGSSAYAKHQRFVRELENPQNY